MQARILTDDPIRAHSYVGAQGWQLVEMPEDPPSTLAGVYERLLWRETHQGLRARHLERAELRVEQGKFLLYWRRIE